MTTGFDVIQETRNCDFCGYRLQGLPHRGLCPECGHAYRERTAYGSHGWREAMLTILRFAWPIAGMAAVITYFFLDGDPHNDFRSPDWLMFVVSLLGLALTITIPINTYRQVRRLAKRVLPPRIRGHAGLFALRVIGTLVCVAGGVAGLLVYLLFMMAVGLGRKGAW